MIPLLVLALVRPVAAQQPPEPQPSAEGPVARARVSFLRGVELVRQEKWAEALVEFDRSLAEHPHPVTFYNVALCHRALGRTVRAVFALERALSGGDELPENTRQDARKLLGELKPRRAFVVLELVAPGGAVSVDGHPIEPLGEAWTPTLSVGGGAARGPGLVRLALEPGEHRIEVTREGHATWLQRPTLAAGDSLSLKATLVELPGVLAVDSRPPGASLRVNEQLTGRLPLLLQRPAGTYRLEVTSPGRVPFTSEVTLRPGLRADVMAELKEERVSVFRRWWFWVGVGVVVTGAAVTTYALTRPTEKADGGTLGWVVRP